MGHAPASADAHALSRPMGPAEEGMRPDGCRCRARHGLYLGALAPIPEDGQLGPDPSGAPPYAAGTLQSTPIRAGLHQSMTKPKSTQKSLTEATARGQGAAPASRRSVNRQQVGEAREERRAGSHRAQAGGTGIGMGGEVRVRAEQDDLGRRIALAAAPAGDGCVPTGPTSAPVHDQQVDGVRGRKIIDRVDPGERAPCRRGRALDPRSRDEVRNERHDTGARRAHRFRRRWDRG